MVRVIDPPRDDWDSLPTRLTVGERAAIELFDRSLAADWEIYVQPYINGLRPDIVLLHPRQGLGVFEVKDWDPKYSRYWVSEREGHEPVLMARYSGQRRDVAIVGQRNPFLRVRDYKMTLHNLGTYALGNRGYGRITAGVIFTIGETEFWRGLSNPFVQDSDPLRYYPVVGSDVFGSGRLEDIFPDAVEPRGSITDRVAGYLRGWLRESDYVRQQREPLPVVSSDQRRLVNVPLSSSTSIRRVRGPAGSGKSFILAARAAKVAVDLAKQGDVDGERILVVGFNITLSNYLHDLTMRHLRQMTGGRKELAVARDLIRFEHYFGWLRVYETYGGGVRYRSILVDEGNDFEIGWWNKLRSCLESPGEMLLAFDHTQDLYRRAGSWDERTMQGAGFRGPWNELESSFRCHISLIPAYAEFSSRFMRGVNANLPGPGGQLGLESAFPLSLRWVQVADRSNWVEVCLDELELLCDRLPEDSGYSDVVSLIPQHLDGFSFVSAVEERFGIDVDHIFSNDPDDQVRQRESAPLKHGFWGGSGKMKAVTVHSFKGWEARHLVVYIDNLNVSCEVSMPVLFYVALTRLVKHSSGSSLTVVCSCPELWGFGERFFDDFALVK